MNGVAVGAGIALALLAAERAFGPPTGVRFFVGGAALALGAPLSSSNLARALAPSTRPSRTAAAGDGGAGASRGRPPRPFSWGASILRSQAHGRYGMSWSTRLVKLVAVLALLG